MVDSRGRIVARSGSLGGGVLGTPAEIARRDRERPRALLGHARAAASRCGSTARRSRASAPARPRAAPCWSRRATEADERDRAPPARPRARRGGRGAALLAIAIALLLTRRALRPLTDLSAAARAIGETGDPTRRLPPAGSSDEVGALSETLNAMLASLERAREAERRFVADASHELRTPLTALRGNAAYIAQHGADREVLADLEDDAERLAHLLDDLLALAREDAAGPGSGELVRLDQLALARAGARVAVDAPDPVTVRGDADALARAIGNLVENGLVHGPAGRARQRRRARGRGPRARDRHRPRARPQRGRRRARVRALLARAGAPTRRAGSGLGLAIVRATAERHGGSVSRRGRRVHARPAARQLISQRALMGRR